MNDNTIEQQIQDKGLTAPRVTVGDIETLLARVSYRGIQPADTTSTFVHAYLDGKFLLATGHSACVSPENFDAQIGMNIAKAQAHDAAREKLWELEGYRLYARLHGEEKAFADGFAKTSATRNAE